MKPTVWRVRNIKEGEKEKGEMDWKGKGMKEEIFLINTMKQLKWGNV